MESTWIRSTIPLMCAALLGMFACDAEQSQPGASSASEEVAASAEESDVADGVTLPVAMIGERWGGVYEALPELRISTSEVQLNGLLLTALDEERCLPTEMLSKGGRELVPLREALSKLEGEPVETDPDGLSKHRPLVVAADAQTPYGSLYFALETAHHEHFGAPLLMVQHSGSGELAAVSLPVLVSGERSDEKPTWEQRNRAPWLFGLGRDGGTHAEVSGTGEERDVLTAKRFLERKRAEVDACEAKARELTPELAGELELRLVFKRSGTLAKLDVTRNTAESKALVACIRDASKGWVLPKLVGKRVGLRWPLAFARPLRPFVQIAVMKNGVRIRSLGEALPADGVCGATVCAKRDGQHNWSRVAQVVRALETRTGAVHGVFEVSMQYDMPIATLVEALDALIHQESLFRRAYLTSPRSL